MPWSKKEGRGKAMARHASAMSGRLTMGLAEIDGTQIALVGAKCARLGELSRIEGLHVPRGFCLTTEAFVRVMSALPLIGGQLDELSRLDAGERDSVRRLCESLRRDLEVVAIPDDVEAAVTRSLAELGPNVACAVRSSATSEDSPAASFAGQHDTYLNVTGPAAIVRDVRRCWASLYAERAVVYRLRHGIDHRKVRMGVMVQEMVYPRAAGVVFTADPLTSNRAVTSIEASFGLGEGLVSALVDPDVYTVRDGRLAGRTIATKSRAIQASPEGGTQTVRIAPERRREPALSEVQILQLAHMARRIEAQFGCPQDIEWCLTGEDFQILQSRPITGLFPVPQRSDGAHHVYVSVGHQQMMTDAMKPLGLSVWQRTAARPMFEAGSRLFVDVTKELSSSTSRAALLETWLRGDPLTGQALRAIAERADFIPIDAQEVTPPGSAPEPAETDPAVVEQLIQRSRASLASLRRRIQTKSAEALLDVIVTDLEDLKRALFDPANVGAIRAALHAPAWLDEHLDAWLGEKHASDILTRSAPSNVTSQMGLDLLDVADAIRPHPGVVAFLRGVEDESFLDALPTVLGGAEARDAISGFLDKYGMRCSGEIDITRPRWSERPTALLPMILSNVERFEPGAARRQFEQGRRDAAEKEQVLLTRLRDLPDGARKAQDTKAMIDRLRTFIGYREYPKYHIVSRYFVYKTALLREAERLVERGVLGSKEDIFFLRIEELYDVVRTNEVDEQLLGERRDAYRWDRSLTPPRVLTSEGEIVTGRYDKEVPSGALAGLPVSPGTVEGRARVVLDIDGAELDRGDILVTAYTDPSWTPLFVGITGLVTEVGGRLTHGAVIAREYGLTAVVGVAGATRLIHDGERIRVNGIEGYVEILDQGPPTTYRT